jgi:hypothetical protein
MVFTTEQIEEIEKLAGINYSVRQIAMYLGVDVNEMMTEYADEVSRFRYHYDRGALISQAQVDMSTVDAAKNGNITAQQRYDKRKKETTYQQLKEELFGRSD